MRNTTLWLIRCCQNCSLIIHYRSPITPDEVPEGFPGVSGRQMFDPDLTPTNTADEKEGGSGRPHIPEPDYDLSDNEEGSCRAGRRRSSTTTMERKKKSVTFVTSEEVVGEKGSGKKGQQQQQAKQPESILKDTSREREREYAVQQHQRQAAIALASDPDRCFDRIPHARLANNAKTAEEKKVRIDISSNNPLARSNSMASPTSPTGRNGAALQKSRSFSADKNPASVAAASTAAKSTSTTTTSSDIKQARAQLKPSRSFPQELGNEEGENSSSGVSSDQEQQQQQQQQQQGTKVEVKYVTRLPVEGPPRPEVVPPQAGNGRQQRWENASESSDDFSSERSWKMRDSAEPGGTTAASSGHIINMSKQMLHPKLQALFDKPSSSSCTLPSMKSLRMAASATNTNEDGHDSTLSSMSSSSSSCSGQQQQQQQQQQSSHYSSKTLPSRSHQRHQQQKQDGKSSGAADERSISESLALIQHHVNTLGDVNKLIGMPNNKPQDQQPVLAPPPGFSDSEGFSDNESLSSAGSQRRSNKTESSKFGFSKVLQHPNRGYSPQSLTEQLRSERKQQKGGNGGLMSKSLDASAFSSSSSKTRRESSGAFRTKPLMGWTQSDVGEWLDSLFLPEHRESFARAGVDGMRLAAGLTRGDLEAMGVVRAGHASSIERSLKKYLN